MKYELGIRKEEAARPLHGGTVRPGQTQSNPIKPGQTIFAPEEVAYDGGAMKGLDRSCNCVSIALGSIREEAAATAAAAIGQWGRALSAAVFVPVEQCQHGRSGAHQTVVGAAGGHPPPA